MENSGHENSTRKIVVSVQKRFFFFQNSTLVLINNSSQEFGDSYASVFLLYL